jgi:hypothetical protein
MGVRSEDTTRAFVSLVYEGIVGLGDSGELGVQAARMRAEFQRRTGTYGPEDPWFEARARAFWDDAIASQGFGVLAAAQLDERAQALAACMARAHRGFFVVEDVDDNAATLVDVWSGAELLVRHLDETQTLTLEHAEGPMDGRVTASPSGPDLWLLPGAYHHPADALDPAVEVLTAARDRGMSTQQALDALLRMELVFRSSSRVKAGFAYRASQLEEVRERG